MLSHLVAGVTILYAVVVLRRMAREIPRPRRLVLLYFFAVILNAGAVVAVPLAEGGLHIGPVRLILNFALVVAVISRLKLTLPNAMVLLFVGYLGLRVPYSTDLPSSMPLYVNMVAGLTMFCVASVLITSDALLQLLARVYVSCALLLVFWFLVFQVPGLGTPVYGGIVLLPGGDRGIYISNILAYCMLLAPLFLRTPGVWRRVGRIGIVLGASVIVALVFRRSAILALLAGPVTYALFATRRTRFIKYIGVVAVLLLVAFPLYAPVLTQVAEQRGGLRSVFSTETGRARDIERAIDEIALSGPGQALFGTELFNSSGYLGTRRNLHADHANVLLGSGLVGLTLFFLMHLVIGASAWRLGRRTRPGAIQTWPFVAAYLVATLVISTANQIWVTSSLMFAFGSLGALHGVERARLAPRRVRIPARARPAPRSRPRPVSGPGDHPSRIGA